MRVLIACEFSATVRDAFSGKGHYAVSCDFLPSETTGNHIQGNVLDILNKKWDLMVAHPPCTRLSVSGARWFKKYKKEQQEMIKFFMQLVRAPIEKIAVENPVGIMSTVHRKPDQIIQPWMFGHGETKATCLWLKNLSPLVPTKIVKGREARIHKMSPGLNRGKERSRFYLGIAEAMADQWGD